MSEYTPSLDEAREDYAQAVSAPLTERMRRRKEFDRMIRAVRAEAWSEGVAWAAVECGSVKSEAGGFEAPGDNPYRDAS